MVSSVVSLGERQQDPHHQLHQQDVLKSSHMRRVLFVTLEFADPIFSGNGVHGRNLVRAMSLFNSYVDVICAVPTDTPLEVQHFEPFHVDDAPKDASNMAGHITMYKLGIGAKSVWRRLDRQSEWEKFRDAIHTQVEPLIEGLNRAMPKFQYDAVMYVDWTGAVAWYDHLHRIIPTKKTIFLNFRVFSTKDMGFSNEDLIFYGNMESLAMDFADETLTLSERDQMTLMDVYELMHHGKQFKKPVAPLYPPLRNDLLNMAQRIPEEEIVGNYSNRKYFVSCVRLSREKNTKMFVDVAIHLKDELKWMGITPVLCGADADATYAKEVRAQFRAAFPDAPQFEFLSADQLSKLLLDTVVNFHPCLYDAFGMTIVEAAAFGAASVVHSNGDVGATEFLTKESQEVILVDLAQSVPDVARAVLETALWAKEQRMRVAINGRKKALSYTERELASALLSHIP